MVALSTRRWISPWTKSNSNEPYITFHGTASQLPNHIMRCIINCDVITGVAQSPYHVSKKTFAAVAKGLCFHSRLILCSFLVASQRSHNMACYLFGAKPLLQIFLMKECIWKCRLKNGAHFPGLNALTMVYKASMNNLVLGTFRRNEVN